MKYKNTQKAIIVLGDRESVQPFGITRDFSPKDIESLPGIDAAVRKGYLKPYEGKEEATEFAVSPRTAVWQSEMSSGKPVKKKTSTGAVVEYVVADSDGSDSVAMSDPDTVTSLEGRKSVDYIEEGVDARKYLKNASQAQDAEFDAENATADTDDKEGLAESEFERDSITDVDEELSRHARELANRTIEVGNIETEGGKKSMTVNKARSASQAMDEELDKENIDASFNDDDTLAENEQEVAEQLDADDEIAKDMTQVFVKNAGSKGGSQPQDVRVVVEQASTNALNELDKANRPSYDDAEVQAGAPARVVDFLKQNFSAKKWSIAKESDAGFLKDVLKVTQSENIRSLVEQRLVELPKEEQK